MCKRHFEGTGQPRSEFVDGPGGNDATLLDHRDAVGNVLNLVEYMGRKKHRRSAVGRFANKSPKRLLYEWIHAGGRLVEEE